MAEEAIFVRLEDTILLKKALAKKLYENNIEQLKISSLLELSQPMVSNYITSRVKIPKKFLDIAEMVAQKIIDGKETGFHTCILFSENKLEGNYFIGNKNEIISDENNKIVNNLTEAFVLLKGKNIGGLIPKVRINIAFAKENASSSEDIAAFLNGLIIVDEKITGYNGIRFGKSKHLSSLLLDLKSKMDVNAIMNIAYVKNLSKMGFKTAKLTRNYRLLNVEKQVDILLHKGDFGIEPCAYVLGKDAVDVSKKVNRINNGFKNEK
jgi:hypothetical protein